MQSKDYIVVDFLYFANFITLFKLSRTNAQLLMRLNCLSIYISSIGQCNFRYFILCNAWKQD